MLVFETEMFDLEVDLEETTDLAINCIYKETLRTVREALLSVCNPDEMGMHAHSDQARSINNDDCKEEALKLGARGATPLSETLL